MSSSRPQSRLSYRTGSTRNTRTTAGTAATANGEGQDESTYELQQDTDSTIPPILVKFIEQMHQGLFNLLFALQRKSKGVESPFWVILLELFELLQLLSFPFKGTANFPWNSNHTSWWISVVNGSVPETLILGNNIIFYVVIVLLGLVLIDAFVVGYYFSQNQFKYVWTLRYMRLICTLFMTVLYIPVIALFTSMLKNCNDTSGQMVSCWTGGLAVRSAVVIIVSIIFVALSATFCLSVFQQDPTDKSEILGRPHSRIEVYQLLMKTILAISFVILEQHTELHWLLVGLCLFASVSVFMLQTWFIPLYRWRFMVMRVVYQGVFVWASFCLLFVMAINDEINNSITIMFFFVMPGVMLLATYAVTTRKNHIKFMTGPIQNPYAVELKARFMLEDHNLLFMHKELGKSTSHVDAEKGPQNEHVLKQVSDLYSECADVNTSSSILYMFWANFSLYHCQNKQRSLVLLAECLKRSPAIDENFVVFRQRKMMNEESSTDNTDMLEFIICESHMKKAAKHERRAVAHQSRFWAELMKAKPDLQKLFLLGSTVNSAVTLADFNYGKAMQSSSKSSAVLRSYSKFLMDVCNNAQRSEDLTERAKYLDELRRRQTTANDGVIDVTSAILNGAADTDSAVFTIDHHGLIMNVNAGVRAIFKFENPQQLIGQNISCLVPAPWDKAHSDYVSKFMTVGEGQIINKLRKVFCIRSDRYLIPAMLLVRQLTFGTSATFVGVFKTVPEGTTSSDYILMDHDGSIRSFTHQCTEFFGDTPEDIERYQTHISDWIENFDDVADQMQNQAGHKIAIEKDDRIIQLNCVLMSTVVANIPVKIIKLTDATVDAYLTNNVSEVTAAMRKEMPMSFYLDTSKLKKEVATKSKYIGNVDEKVVATKEIEAHKANDKDVHHGPIKKSRNIKKRTNSQTNDNASDTSSLNSNEGVVVATAEDASYLRNNSAPSSVRNSDKASTHKSANSQGSTTVNRLMRLSFAKKIEATSGRLSLSRKIILFMFFLTIIDAIAVNLYTSNVYSTHNLAMQHLADVTNNHANSVVLLQKVRQLFDPSFTSDQKSTLRGDVAAMSTQISDVHFALFNAAASLATIDGSIFTNPNLVVVTGMIGSNTTVSSTLSLNDAVNQMTAQASLMALRQGQNIAMDVTLVIDLLANLVVNTMDEPMKSLIASFLSVYAGDEYSYNAPLYAISLVPMLFIYTVLLVIIGSTLIRTNADAKVVYKLFLDVPKVEIKSMHTKCVAKLALLDGAVAVDTSAEGDKRNNTEVSNIFDFETFLGPAARSTDSDGMEVKSSDEMRNIKMISVRMIVFAVLTATYFITYMIYSFAYLQQTSTYGSNIVWSAYVNRMSQETNFDIASLYDNGTLYGDYSTRRTRLNVTLNNLDVYVDGYLNGIPEIGLLDYYSSIKPVLQGFPSADDQLNLMFDTPSSYIIPDDTCASLAYTTMDHGILNTVTEFVDLAMDVTGAIDAAPMNVSRALSQNFVSTQTLNTMALHCYPIMWAHFVDFFVSPSVSMGNLMNSTSQNATNAILVVALVLLFFMSIDPLMKSIEKEVALTPSMLMMLPVNVLMKVESIRAFTHEASALK